MRRPPTDQTRYTRSCLVCGGKANVLAPREADDLDVSAAFAAGGRELGDEHGEPVGVACFRCARRVWRGADHRGLRPLAIGADASYRTRSPILPELGTVLRHRLEARFWDNVERPADDGVCWRWRGKPSTRGYGQLGVWWPGGRTTWLAHRLAYALLVGPLPPAAHDSEWTIDHLCRNKLCVNPRHLELVTRAENTLRKYGAAA